MGFLVLIFSIFTLFNFHTNADVIIYFTDLTDNTFTKVDSSIYSVYTITQATDSDTFLNTKTLPPLIQKNLDNSIFQQCADKTIIGGPNIFGYADSISILRIDIPEPFPSHIRSFLFFSVYNFNVNSFQTLQAFYAEPFKEMNVSMNINPPLTDTTNYCGNIDIETKTISVVRPLITRKLSYYIVLFNQSTTPPAPGFIGIRNLSLWLDLCDPSCESCDYSFCITCVANSIIDPLNIQSCKCDTSKGFYWNTTCVIPNKPCNWVCNTCPTNCSTCDNKTNNNSNIVQCITCLPGYLLTIEAICLKTCPQRFYSDGLRCYACDSSCFSCSGPSKYECLTCNSSEALYNGSCVSQCPYMTYNYTEITQIKCGDCDNSCNSCDGPYNTNCLTCLNNNQYLDNGFCADTCPDNKYQYELDKLCLICDVTCSTCSGPQPTDCIKCLNPLWVLNNNLCISQCPDEKYPSSTYMSSNNSSICQVCELYCKKCIGENQCELCLYGYYYDEINKNCNLPKNLSFYINEITNPTKFSIVFSDYWGYIDQNYNEIFHFSLKNNSEFIALTYQIIKVTSIVSLNPNSYIFYFQYNQTIPSNSDLSLTIDLNIIYDNTDFQYKLMDNSTSYQIFLNEYKFLNNSDIYYDINTQSIMEKLHLIPNLLYTDEIMTFTLSFNYPINNLSLLVLKYSEITISGFNDSEFIYNISMSDLQNFLLKIKPFKSIVLYPKLQYSINIPSDYIILNNLNPDISKASITLYDYYILSDEVKDQIISCENQKAIAVSVTQASSALGTSFSGGNPSFIQGIMLTELIMLLRYTKVDFPYNLEFFFKQQNNQNVLYFSIGEGEEKAENSLPPDYRKKKISPYFINNVGNIIFQNAMSLSIAFILVIITEKSMSNSLIWKLIRFIRRKVVWGMVFFFFIGPILNFCFYIVVTLVYPAIISDYGKFNTVFACIFLIFTILFIYHLYFVIKICCKQKSKVEISSNMKPVKKKHSKILGKIFAFDEKISIDLDNNKRNRSYEEKSNDYNDINEAKTKDSKPISYNNNSEINVYKAKDVNNTVLGNKGNDPEKSQTYDTFFLKANELEIVNIENKISSVVSFSQKSIISLPSATRLKAKHQQMTKKDFKIKLKQKSSIKDENDIDEIPEECKNDAEKWAEADKSQCFSPNTFKKEIYYHQQEKKPINSIIVKKPILLNIQPFKFLYDPIDIERYLKDHGHLHEVYKNIAYIRYFLLVDYIRQIILSILIALLRSQPLIQMIILNVINLLFLISILIFRPFSQPSYYIYTFINETTTEISLLSVLGLAFMDFFEDNDIEKRMNLGWGVIYSNLILYYWLNFCTAVTMISLFIRTVRKKGRIFNE